MNLNMINVRPDLRWDEESGTLSRWDVYSRTWIQIIPDHPFGKLSTRNGYAIRDLVYNIGCDHYLTQLPETIVDELVALLNQKIREPTKEELIEMFPFMKDHIE
jgi:hypothetical protein